MFARKSGVRCLCGLLLATLVLAGCRIYIGQKPPKPVVEPPPPPPPMNDGPPPRHEHAVISLQPGQELEIFYPVPFASPPNLQLANMHPPESKIVIEGGGTVPA